MSSLNGINNNQPVYKFENEKNNEKTGKDNGLGKDAFLQILVTQLRNQDPLSPMEDKDFIAQMAQFSTLEQIQNLDSHLQLSQLGIKLTIDDAIKKLAENQSKIVDSLNSIQKALDAYGKGEKPEETKPETPDKPENTTE
ncbi:flagellar basal body rod modification protein FlgD [Gottschalkia purinilytica]|uniref:Flagellar basal body rod modification protein FlgD n=1 Tax=Gottschalkia purinilytica TaxID=1503 RepID=A0A0L0WBK1_GOTPU|nr:flagellar hook capping FlgD N-terminal domain-containing protein [Gottschalkia purinilytica]KNF08817.1 flagellar basal body rod modification protein FlgD [Gottschalkia purinilytica]